MKKVLILVLTNFFILTLLLLGKPVKAQTTTITGQFLYGLQLYVLPEKQTTPNYSTAIYSSTIDENDFITSGLYENWLQPRLPDGINGYIYLVDSTHTIKNVYLGGGYLEQGQTLSYPYEPSIEMKHYGAPLIDIFLLNPVNKIYFETPTLDYIVYFENNDGTTPRIKLIDATTNENDYNRVKLAINGYDTGYNAGYSIGYNNGQVNGYNNGYEDGQNNGYSAGYNAGQYDFYNEYYQQIYDEGYNAGLGDRQLGVNTVVNFNQLIQNGNFESSLSGNFFITSSNPNPTITRENNALKIEGFYPIYSNNGLQQTISYIANHKYLISVNLKNISGVARNFELGQTYGTQHITIYLNDNEEKTIQTIIQPEIVNGLGYNIISLGGTTLNLSYSFIVKNFMLFDLTQIYGIGNEPENIETFINDFPSEYYPYTTSTYVNIDYENGYKSGYDNGYPVGYDDGKSYQATQQLTSDGWIQNIFTGISAFLSIQILPGVSIGLIVGLPFIITVAWFVLKMARGGSSE